MSYRQCIQVFHPVDVEKYMTILAGEFAARPNDEQPGTFLIGDPPLPFYAPTLIDDHLAIVSFNRLPLSPILLEALWVHPELVPLTAPIKWLEEQELLTHGTLENVGRFLQGKER